MRSKTVHVLGNKGTFSFEIQSSYGVHWGLVPGAPRGPQICQCSGALVGPTWAWAPHPLMPPPLVFDRGEICKCDTSGRGGPPAPWDLFLSVESQGQRFWLVLMVLIKWVWILFPSNYTKRRLHQYPHVWLPPFPLGLHFIFFVFTNSVSGSGLIYF